MPPPSHRTCEAVGSSGRPRQPTIEVLADLSHLLGAVYGDGQHDPDGPPVPVEPPATQRSPDPPDWADDAHLDAAFADWTPGPPDEAPPAERAVVAEVIPPATGKPLADDIAAALSEALVPKRAAAAELTATTANGDHIPVKDEEPEPAPQPAPVEKAVLLPAPAAPAVHVARQWERSDDDILPTRRAKGLRISLPLRRG